MNYKHRNERSRLEYHWKAGKRQLRGVKEGHWPEFAAHCMWLLCWPVHLLLFTTYGIDRVQGEQSKFAVRSVSDLNEAGDALKSKSDIVHSMW